MSSYYNQNKGHQHYPPPGILIFCTICGRITLGFEQDLLPHTTADKVATTPSNLHKRTRGATLSKVTLHSLDHKWSTCASLRFVVPGSAVC